MIFALTGVQFSIACSVRKSKPRTEDGVRDHSIFFIILGGGLCFVFDEHWKMYAPCGNRKSGAI